MEALKRPEVKRTLGVLQLAKSRVLRTWRELVRLKPQVYIQDSLTQLTLTVCADVSGPGHHHRCQRGQRQREVSVHPGQVLQTPGEVQPGKLTN